MEISRGRFCAIIDAAIAVVVGPWLLKTFLVAPAVTAASIIVV
jgi:hypothetical protein